MLHIWSSPPSVTYGRAMIRRGVTKRKQRILLNVGLEVKYRIDVRRVTNLVHIELR